MVERSGPLSNVRVLDLSRIMAGPWATQMMADLGAEVIKIERPRVGDDTRSWGPPFLKDAEGKPTRESGYYLSVNRGKRSVTVDISQPDGQAVVRRLAQTCDVVIENFKAGALAKYGLDAVSLRTLRPELIYCSLTGFGQSGPRRDQAAYDFAIQGMGGLMSVTGERDGQPGAGPQKVGVPVIDLMTGMYAAVAVLAALHRRAETGQGEAIDIAMLDVATAMLSNQAMNALLTNRAPKRGGNRHPNIQPQDVFAAGDGQFVLAVGNDGQFASLARILGHAEWAEDPRFATNAARVGSEGVLSGLLCQAFAQWSRADLLDALEGAGVPAAAINSVPEALAEPQVVHRQMVRDIPHPLAGTVRQIVSPMNFEEAPLAFDQAAPLLGADTEAVLEAIGVNAAERETLAAKGAI